MVDRVRPLKWERPETGGTQTDTAPTSNNPNQDYPDVRGITIQNDSSNDETVIVSRDASDNLTFQDDVVSGVKTLTDLLASGSGMSEAAHKIIRQLIHFMEDGPAEGGYRETTGTVFPTAKVWYETSSKLKKIYEKLTTWTGINATQIVRKIYATDGVTVLATATDTITYSGVFETNRTRVIT